MSEFHEWGDWSVKKTRESLKGLGRMEGIYFIAVKYGEKKFEVFSKGGGPNWITMALNSETIGPMSNEEIREIFGCDPGETLEIWDKAADMYFDQREKESKKYASVC